MESAAQQDEREAAAAELRKRTWAAFESVGMPVPPSVRRSLDLAEAADAAGAPSAGYPPSSEGAWVAVEPPVSNVTRRLSATHARLTPAEAATMQAELREEQLQMAAAAAAEKRAASAAAKAAAAAARFPLPPARAESGPPARFPAPPARSATSSPRGAPPRSERTPSFPSPPASPPAGPAGHVAPDGSWMQQEMFMLQARYLVITPRAAEMSMLQARIPHHG